MANEVRAKFDSAATFTMTLASLANASGRQSDLITNTNSRPAAIVYLKITSGGSAPTAGASYDVYLLRGDAASPTYVSDGAGASDAAITIENSQYIGSIIVTATAAKAFYGEFDTAAVGMLGPRWGIAVMNRSNQALSATEGDHYKAYAYYVPEVQ